MTPQWLQKAAAGRNVVAALIVWIGFSIFLFNAGAYKAVQAAAGGAKLLEERFGYTGTQAVEFLQALRSEGREAYGSFQFWDGINALLMAVALTLALAFALDRLFAARNPLRLIAFLPLAAGLCEWAENAALFSLLSSFPNEAPSVCGVASALTQVKLVLGFSVMPLTILSFLALGLKALRQRLKK